MLVGLMMFVVLAAVLGLVLTPLLERYRRAAPEPHVGTDGAALDWKKKFLLRELKDIEMDYLMGKLSDDDYAEMIGNYKAQAVAVMKEIDAHAGKARPARADSHAQAVEPEGQPTGSEPTSQSTHAAAVYCPDCGSNRHPDARFCASCGKKLT